MAWGFKRTGYCLGLAIIVGLWTASTPLFAHWSVKLLEAQYPAKTVESYPASDVAILLGGAAYGANAENPYGDVTEAGDRILHAYRIYKAGKARKILISGGNLFHTEARPEAETIADMLVSPALTARF
jgi:vancomycin permeability regulator SanA